jgi:hypothetical protein
MHETKLVMKKIEVQAQAFAPGAEETGPILSVSKFKALAGLYRSDDTDKPLSDPITSGDMPSMVLLAQWPVYVNIGPPTFFSHGFGMVFDSFRVRGHKSFEILKKKALMSHKLFHALCPADRQIAFEQNSIKTSYRSGDFSCMLIDKLLHGVLPYVAVAQLPH